jgi:hypothetical protein
MSRSIMIYFPNIALAVLVGSTTANCNCKGNKRYMSNKLFQGK